MCAGLFLASCGFPTEDSPSAIAGDTRPDATGPGGSEVVTATDEVTAWFIQDDLLVPRPREVSAPVNAAEVVTVLGEGVSPSETESGLRSSIPDAAMLLGAEVGGGTATVELAPEFLEIAPGDQVLALGQVVLTLTDLRGIGRVRFLIDGLAVSTPLPDGTSTEDSVSREDFRVLAEPG
jgi:spore germination protein GerM